MESLKFTLAAYELTFIFVILIACFIPALAGVIQKMNLDRDEEVHSLAVPSADSMQVGGNHRRRTLPAQMKQSHLL